MRFVVEDFEVRVSKADEKISAKTPWELVCKLAEKKARAIKTEEDAIIIGADTIVYLDGRVLGKPSSRKEAEEMIREMAGRVHEVYTGLVLLNVHSGRMLTDYACTAVEFSPMSPAEIEEYLDADEYLDKAGGYAIQGAAAKYIKGISGCFYNVMGLPVHKLYQMLKEIMR